LIAPPTALQPTVAVVCVTEDAARPAGLPQATPAPIVKLELEISKKILPTASTFMRLVVPGVDGMVTTSEPSFAVDEANIVGKVFPPSVDNKMFTEAQLTEPPLVPLTLHVTVAGLPPAHVTFVLGAVTWNGPAVLVTVTTTSVKAVWPTAAGDVENGWLSRTVNLKFNVLETELNASMFVPASPPGKGGVTFKPANMVDNFGKILVADVVGLNDNQFGPVVFVGEATLPVPEVVELSFCSQQYVSASPFASVAELVRKKGVLIGMV
jgi:hypothetical protein